MGHSTVLQGRSNEVVPKGYNKQAEQITARVSGIKVDQYNYFPYSHI